jgi:hypothetical protein
LLSFDGRGLWERAFSKRFTLSDSTTSRIVIQKLEKARASHKGGLLRSPQSCICFVIGLVAVFEIAAERKSNRSLVALGDRKHPHLLDYASRIINARGSQKWSAGFNATGLVMDGAGGENDTLNAQLHGQWLNPQMELMTRSE